jgi:hypothetical protein
LIRAIEAALSNDEKTVARVAAARQRVETDLSFDARMAAVEAIYTDLFEHRGAANAAATVPAQT